MAKELGRRVKEYNLDKSIKEFLKTSTNYIYSEHTEIFNGLLLLYSSTKKGDFTILNIEAKPKGYDEILEAIVKIDGEEEKLDLEINNSEIHPAKIHDSVVGVLKKLEKNKKLLGFPKQNLLDLDPYITTFRIGDHYYTLTKHTDDYCTPIENTPAYAYTIRQAISKSIEAPIDHTCMWTKDGILKLYRWAKPREEKLEKKVINMHDQCPISRAVHLPTTFKPLLYEISTSPHYKTTNFINNSSNTNSLK